MLSPFRASGPEEARSGGKAARGRRRAVSASPYARPGNSPPPPGPQGRNPKWFSGIITGAGRLLSAFRSDGGESSSSQSSGAEEGDPGSSDEDENADACAEEFRELGETGRSFKSMSMRGEGPQLTTQSSETKLAIEKLLLQETFSRDEGDRLVKIIQSRISDTLEDGIVAGQTELPDRTVYSDVTFLGTWRSLNRGRKFPEGLTYSSNHLNDLSPGTSIFHAYSHGLGDKAIMEAKEWLEKKKMHSTSKSELDCGPCTLNTAAHQSRVEDEGGSPVDIAKSYMRARPPWQSPILNHIGFKASHTGTLLFKEEAPYVLRGGSFSSPKLLSLKRGYLDTDFGDTRSVRLKSMESPSDSAMFQQVESSIGMLEHEAHQTADESNLAVACTNHDSNPLSTIEASKAVDASAGVPAMLAVEDGCPEVILSSPAERAVKVNASNSIPSSEITKQVDLSKGMVAKFAVEDGCPEAILGSHDGKTFEVNHSTNDEVNTESDKINETCNLSSTNFIPDPEDNVNGAHLNHEMSTQTVLPTEMETGLESLSSGSDCPDLGQPGAAKDLSLGPESADVHIDTNQDLKEASSVEKQVNSVSVPGEFASPEYLVNHNDARDSVMELLNVEQGLALEGVESSSISNINQPANNSNIHDSGVHISTEIRQDHRSPSSELLPTFEVNDTPVDIRLLEGKDKSEKEVTSPTGFTANGNLSLQSGSSSNPYIVSLKKGSRHLAMSVIGGSATAVPTEPGDISDGCGTGSNLKKPQNGTTMKSIEQMLAENSPNTRRGRGRGRGRRAAAWLRSGRGRRK
uniref:Trigger factor n=1 Tax=Anthurium amnicola TaxID=1678845 RepID=A0A1D1YJ17_9ARAE